MAGRSGGSWSGGGIISTAAAASSGTRTVGYLLGADEVATVSFAAAGDTNLDGQVNVFDLVGIMGAARYGTGSAAIWSQGDFNYDGLTDVFDLVGIATSGTYGNGSYLSFGSPPTVSGGVAIVPEPASWGLVFIGLAVAGCGPLGRPSGPRRGKGRVSADGLP